MFSIRRQSKIYHLLDLISAIGFIVVLYSSNHNNVVPRNQYILTFLMFVILLFIAEVRVKMKGKLDSKLNITIKPEQYEKISEIVQKKNITVDQFCIEVIDEKLDKSI